MPSYSIYYIDWLTPKKAQELRDSGILDINDVPDNFPLSAKQRVQVDVAQLGFPKIDRKGVVHELEKLTSPRVELYPNISIISFITTKGTARYAESLRSMNPK